MNEYASSSHEMQRELDWSGVFHAAQTVACEYGVYTRGGAGYGAPEEINLIEYTLNQLPESIARRYPGLDEIVYVPAYEYVDEYGLNSVDAAVVVRLHDDILDTTYRINQCADGGYDTIGFYEPRHASLSTAPQPLDAYEAVFAYLEGDHSVVVDHELLAHVEMTLSEDRALTAEHQQTIHRLLGDVRRALKCS